MPNEQTSVPLYAASEVLTAANMNISAGTGVPVFATTVTRDAAFGGAGEKVLAEGQLCYLSSTNVVQYYDGAAWATVGPTTAGLIPIAPTSVAVGSGTGTANALGTVTFSGVSSVSLNGVFTATYSTYRIVSNIEATTGTADIYFRARASGVDNSSANYTFATTRAVFSTAALSVSDSGVGSTSMMIGKAILNDKTQSIIDIANPFTADPTNLTYKQIAVLYNYSGGGLMTVNTVYDGFTLLPSANTLAGTITVYGYNQ